LYNLAHHEHSKFHPPPYHQPLTSFTRSDQSGKTCSLPPFLRLALTLNASSYGWVVLCLAGGGAYYFAKKSIVNDRTARAAADRQRAAEQARLREQEYLLASTKLPPGTSSSPPGTITAAIEQRLGNGNGAAVTDEAGNPSREASAHDPAPTRHAPETEGQRVAEKSKYEASEVWRSRKGDRFS
jgi:Domain of unknown function (DUF4748)